MEFMPMYWPGDSHAFQPEDPEFCGVPISLDEKEARFHGYVTRSGPGVRHHMTRGYLTARCRVSTKNPVKTNIVRGTVIMYYRPPMDVTNQLLVDACTKGERVRVLVIDPSHNDFDYGYYFVEDLHVKGRHWIMRRCRNQDDTAP
jgi:hypothetical protein